MVELAKATLAYDKVTWTWTLSATSEGVRRTMTAHCNNDCLLFVTMPLYASNGNKFDGQNVILR